MPRRRDSELVDAVAREAALTRGGRLALGGALEREKERGAGGNRNARGDFTRPELRELAAGLTAPVADRHLAHAAELLEEERHARALAGATVFRARAGLDGAPALHLGDRVLRLPSTGWLLREDGRTLARAEDEPAWALGRLGELVGCRVARADVRRHDRALLLELDEELELLVRDDGWELRDA